MTTVTITTAVKPSAKQLDPLKKAIEKQYGSELDFVSVVDPNVLGGIKVQVGSTQFDATVKHKFNQLRSQVIR
jgi:F-type H+-transporting ATPase subunit delta